MESKQKGNIGFSAVVLELHKNEFNVFSEIGDFSKVDLIAEKNSKITRIQIKYSVSRKDGGCVLSLRKSGPNGYRYTYTENDCDWFAVYNPVKNEIYWISSKEACKNSRMITSRTEKSKNNQSKGVRNTEDYSIKNFLKEFDSLLVPQFLADY